MLSRVSGVATRREAKTASRLMHKLVDRKLDALCVATVARFSTSFGEAPEHKTKASQLKQNVLSSLAKFKSSVKETMDQMKAFVNPTEATKASGASAATLAMAGITTQDFKAADAAFQAWTTQSQHTTRILGSATETGVAAAGDAVSTPISASPSTASLNAAPASAPVPPPTPVVSRTTDIHADLADAAGVSTPDAPYGISITTGEPYEPPGLITGSMVDLLTFFHDTFDLSWHGSVVALVIFVRLITLPFLRMSAVSAYAMTAAQPEIKRINDTIATTPEEQKAKVLNVMSVMQAYGASPGKMFMGVISSMPLFVVSFLAIRHVATNPVNTVSLKAESFLLWSDFSSIDSTYSLPVIAAATTLLALQVNSQFRPVNSNQNPASQKFSRLMFNFLRVLTVCSIPITAYFPMLLFFYWIPNSIIMMAWTVLTRTALGRKILFFPDVSKIQAARGVLPAPTGFFAQQLKNATPEQLAASMNSRPTPNASTSADTVYYEPPKTTSGKTNPSTENFHQEIRMFVKPMQRPGKQNQQKKNDDANDKKQAQA